jgi:hypothetical protein
MLRGSTAPRSSASSGRSAAADPTSAGKGGTASVSDFSALDADVLNEWAESLAAEYPTMSADEQQQLAIMAPLRCALLETWPMADWSNRPRPTSRAT